MSDTSTEPGSRPEREDAASRMQAGQAEARQRTPGDGNGGTTSTATMHPASVARLFRQVVDDVTLLVRSEMQLATSEVANAIDEAKAGAGAAIGGGAVMYAGVLFLLAAATLGLAEIMPGWAAALIVGGVVTLIGLIMFMTGRSKVQPESFTPRHTMDSLRKDRDMVGRQTHPDERVETGNA
ncbi:MAG: phage holin family protein [Pseudomonadota bacterium]